MSPRVLAKQRSDAKPTNEADGAVAEPKHRFTVLLAGTEAQCVGVINRLQCAVHHADGQLWFTHYRTLFGLRCEYSIGLIGPPEMITKCENIVAEYSK